MSLKANDQYNEAEHEAEQEQKYMEEKHTKMSKAKFIELTGENPEDVLGEDWENLVDDYIEEEERDRYGELYG